MSVWATLVPSGITGIVGLAGIAGTAWQAKRGREAASADLRASLDAAAGNLRLSISAESDRERNAVRRDTYVRFLSAYGEAMRLQRRAHEYGEHMPAEKVAELVSAGTKLRYVVNEISLTAPMAILLAAMRLSMRVWDYENDPELNGNDDMDYAKTLALMGQDMGVYPLVADFSVSEVSGADVNSPVVDRPVKRDDAQ